MLAYKVLYMGYSLQYSFHVNVGLAMHSHRQLQIRMQIFSLAQNNVIEASGILQFCSVSSTQLQKWACIFSPVKPIGISHQRQRSETKDVRRNNRRDRKSGVSVVQLLTPLFKERRRIFLLTRLPLLMLKLSSAFSMAQIIFFILSAVPGWTYRLKLTTVFYRSHPVVLQY